MGSDDIVTTRDALWGAGSMVLGTLLLGRLINIRIGTIMLGIGLLIVGLLMLMNTIPGPTVVGGALFVTALLLLITNPIGRWLGKAILSSIPTLAGTLLLVAGLTLILGDRKPMPGLPSTTH